MQPEKIGRYEIKSELGRGGMATVYRGYDPRFEREVAVKVLPPELLHADPQFRARFEREAKIIAQLEHPSIVPVYDVGEENNQPYFVMRFMNGGSLSERIKAGIMSVGEAAKILDQIAPGLDEAHAKGFVHRDLKPSNILFDVKGSPYISDFGIAKITQGQSGTMTGSGIIGTPAYMAPEQATGDQVDGRADIYAVGIILFEMLTGKQPYEADTPMAVAIKHVTDPVPRILTVNPNLPADMDLIIQKAMAKNRDERFFTAVELVQTLKELAGEFGPEKKTQTLTALRTAVKKKSKDGKRKFSPVTALLILLGVAGVAAAGIFLANRNSPGLSPEATATALQTSTPDTFTSQPTIESTSTSAPATETATLLPPTETAVVPQIPLIGGADMVAFLRNNDIWIMNVDGSELRSVTTDAREKFNVEWLPDGDTILYVTGSTVKTVNIEDLREEIVTSFAASEYFDAFRVSPDGKHIAISVNRELHVVPFDLAAFPPNPSKAALLAMNGCLLYNDIGVKNVLWSDDSQKLAIEFVTPSGANVADTIRVLDIHLCQSSAPIRLDEFPAARFPFPLEIVTFNWDGDLLFALNTNKRNSGFGDLFFYNTFTHKAEPAAPVEGKCCYRDAAFSPDGTYIIFAFQDINLGTESPIVLYYIPTGSLTTEGALEAIPLPDGFFTRRNDSPLPVFRPVQP